MKVAVDIDGTLSKTFEKYGEEAAKRGHDTSGQAEFFDTWETKMLFPKVPSQAMQEIYEANWREMRSSYELYPGADWILHFLDVACYGLTNRRVFENADTCSVTQEWVVRHGIPLKKIIHTTDKALVCKEKNFSVLIEDSPKNAFPVAEQGVIVLLHDQPYNRHVEHANVIRFTHWLEVPALLRRVAQSRNRG